MRHPFAAHRFPHRAGDGDIADKPSNPSWLARALERSSDFGQAPFAARSSLPIRIEDAAEAGKRACAPVTAIQVWQK
jgi:hypothetical protein